MDSLDGLDPVVVTVVEQIEESAVDDGLLVFSSGVVLRTKPMPKNKIADVMLALERQRPKVPVLWLEEKGRKEENPNDPEYLDAMEEFAIRLVLRVLDLVTIYATEIESKPETIPDVNNPIWHEELEYFGITIPQSPNLRYLIWVKKMCLVTDEDTAKWSNGLLKVSGILEAEVQAEMDRFRSDTERGTDLPPSN
jgi:hypothetical protein